MRFTAAQPFSDGLASVSREDAEKKWVFGYINSKFEVVIPFEFDYTSSFQNRYAQVRKLKTKNDVYIDVTGKVIPEKSMNMKIYAVRKNTFMIVLININIKNLKT